MTGNALQYTLLGTAAAYLLISLATFIVYGWDKWCAKRNNPRVPEWKLHLLALFGGWPGAMLGQQLFRHKSSKRSFLIVYRITIGLNLMLLGAFLAGVIYYDKFRTVNTGSIEPCIHRVETQG